MTKIPKGLCQCGCGRTTPIASRNRKNLGWIKGEPMSYLKGHNRCAPRGPEVPEGMKWCGTCQTIKSKGEFFKATREADGLQGFCKACSRDKQAIWRANNREKHNRLCADARRKKRLGIEPHEYDALIDAQDGCCAICKGLCITKTDTGIQKSLAVDHDHETGAVRGLLCARCNTAIGLLEDDPARIAAALAYLASHKPGAWFTDAACGHECSPQVQEHSCAPGA